MKKHLLFKSLLLLCALVAGTSAWADPTTYTFTSIPTTGWSKNGGSQTINSISWTYSSSTFIGEQSSKIQVGSKNNPQTSAWTIQTAVSNFGTNKKVTAIAITAYTTATTATYDISAGGSSVKSGSLTTSSATYTADGLNITSGDIVVTMTGSSTSKAMYLSNISVTYDDVSTDPAINASSNVNVACDATSGEIPYTISNPDGSTLSVTKISGDWISNVVLDTDNSKVTFDAEENEGAERTGTIRFTYGSVTKDVTITQAVGVVKHVVTINTPENGTLVVKRGETAIASGDRIPEGTVLNIVTTPADGYRLKNWQAVDGSTHTYTATFTYTINTSDVTIKANFELIPEHTATFYINGTKDSEAVVKEGSAIAFPSISIAGQKFLGWTTAAIDGTQTTKPAVLVTEATMSTADINYYAVFGVAINAYFDASDITATPKDGSSLKWTHTATGIYISLTAGSHYTNGTPNTFTVTNGTSNYLQVTAPNNCILEKIIVTLSGSNYKINSVQTGASLATDGTTQTVTFTADKSSIRCYATNSYQIRATTIAVKALGYCTTIPTTTTPAVTSFGWATYIAENDMQFAEGDAYIVTDADFTDGLTIAEATSVSKGTPLLLKGEGAKTATLLATTPDALVANLLSVCNGTIADGKYAYVLAKNGANACFKQWTGTAATLNGRVVLLLDQAAAARGIFELDDDATGIKQVETSKQNAEGFYNLAGQRIAQPTKGLYIVNGKKVIIK